MENPAGDFSQELRKKENTFFVVARRSFNVVKHKFSELKCCLVVLSGTCKKECCNSTFSLFLLCRLEKKWKVGLGN